MMSINDVMGARKCCQSVVGFHCVLMPTLLPMYCVCCCCLILTGYGIRMSVSSSLQIQQKNHFVRFMRSWQNLVLILIEMNFLRHWLQHASLSSETVFGLSCCSRNQQKKILMVGFFVFFDLCIEFSIFIFMLLHRNQKWHELSLGQE